MKDKTLWIMCGAPGSGKTYLATHFMMKGPGWRYISRDQIRYDFLAEGEDYFAHESEVFDIFVYKIKSALNEEGVFNVIADATHLHWPGRRKLLHALGQEIHLNSIAIIPVVIDTTLEQAQSNNKLRSGFSVVPEDVIERMWRSFRDPMTDPFIYDGCLHLNNKMR